MKRLLLLIAALFFMTGFAMADITRIDIHETSSTGVGKALGTITVRDTPYGALFIPKLEELTPGLHGFHVHQNPDCGPATKDGKQVPGLAAGGHYDPQGTGSHDGPYGNGHLGDLPPLYVDEKGDSTMPVLAPRVQVSDIRNRSLMIHAGGDNFSDRPKKLGGGGPRVACGVVP